MATYTRIVFSEQAFNNEILRICDQALDDAIGHILGNEWFQGSTPQQADSNGMESYFIIPANSLKAWIVEYGQGRGAETDRNPYWDDYLKSGLTHENRPSDGTVLKRGSDDYYSVDFTHGEIRHYDRGAEPSGDPVNQGLQKASTRKAEPFLQDLLREAFRVFEASFENYIKNFNMQKCFITTQETV